MRRLPPFIVVLVIFGLAPIARSQGPVPLQAVVSGSVFDADSGAPIAEARVVVGPIVRLTGSDGMFAPIAIPLGRALEEVDVEVTAAGYTPWRFMGLLLRADQPVELLVKLRRARAPLPAPAPRPAPAPAMGAPSAIAPPPAYIEIGRTRDLVGTTRCVHPSTLVNIPVERMRFVDYVRNVLPNEWIASWPAAALDAGAVAVKQYAWYHAFIRPKWRNQGYPFDLLDSTCDQVYTPGSAHAQTDAAVERTWSLTLIRDGRLFPTYYRAYDYQCGTIADCMGQWGSYDRALMGESGAEILYYYYGPAEFDGLFSSCVPATTPAAAPVASSAPDATQHERVYLPLVKSCRN